jgi:hypothetical protein
VIAARISRLLCLLATCFAAAALVTGAGASAARAQAASAGVGTVRICSGCPSSGGDLSRYGYVILNSSDAPLLPALKAANPGLKALVYKNLAFTLTYSCSGGVDSRSLTTGVGYCDADTNHPDWFLTDTTGNRISSSAFPAAQLMDVGNGPYQDRWLANVTNDLGSAGWDGVFVDDADATMNFHLGSRTIAKYQTDAAWRSATRSMLAKVGPALQSAGFLVVPNLYTPWMANYDALGVWKDWLQFTSGGAQEYYTKWGTTSSGWFAGSDWTFRQSFQVATAQAGKIFLGITYAPKTDARSMSYARANFLLFDGGGARNALVFEPSDPEAQDPYAAAWTSDIGTPIGERYHVGAAWRRNYSGGTVLVNPSSATVTVALEQVYYDDAGVRRRSLTLGPTTGAVLHRDGAAASGAPPASSPRRAPAIILQATRVSGAVRLSWSGLSSSRVDVLRNGARIATVSNSGSYRGRLSRKATGRFSYRVCAAGKSVCSSSASVTVGAPTSLAAAASRSALRVVLARLMSFSLAAPYELSIRR